MSEGDTIAAIATATGSGGIGVVRLSGPRAIDIGQALCGHALVPRHAHHTRFADENGESIDDGIALAFIAPASYTGEDVVELQAHGSPAVLQSLLERCCLLGARRARAGEFSERAYLNGRLDLAQAEAVADLIASGDVQSARAARRSLEGVFSQRIDALAEALVVIRVHVEAAIDFADEPIDALGGDALRAQLEAAIAQLDTLLRDAERGRRLRDGLHTVIVGPPNAGKSSLLNALAGSARAIVTPIPGTTRDLLHETVSVDGVALTLVDTAGLRDAGDEIEREGMRRARLELEQADLALVVVDAREPEQGIGLVHEAIATVPHRIIIHNKTDLLEAQVSSGGQNDVLVSAKTGAGLDVLHTRLRALVLGEAASHDGTFSARMRHIDALHRSATLLGEAATHLRAGYLDLAAEALRQAHGTLGEITGRTLPDDLLGRIFASFCIGK